MSGWSSASAGNIRSWTQGSPLVEVERAVRGVRPTAQSYYSVQDRGARSSAFLSLIDGIAGQLGWRDP